MMRLLLRLGVTLAALMLVTSPSLARAAVGDLAAAGCVTDSIAKTEAACTQAPGAVGMVGARTVAVSFDGKSVYVGSRANSDVVVFHRSTPNGSLAYVQCVGHTIGCTHIDGSLDPVGIAVSKDGKSVYVASDDGTLQTLNRSATDGSLTGAGCFKDTDSTPAASCSPVDGLDSSGGLNVVASPDGANVYVGSIDGVARFDRNGTGALTAHGCVNADASDGCTTVAHVHDGAGLGISPDGVNVYVAHFGITVSLTRAGGALSFQSCTDSVATNGCIVSSVPNEGLSGRIVVSADGRSAYDTDINGILVAFNRGGGGALTYESCIQDSSTSPTFCATKVPGLSGAFGVAVSPDGKSVYVTGHDDNAVVQFSRSTEGALTPRGCIGDNDGSTDPGCTQTTDGLKHASGIAVDPSGANVFVASFNDDALVVFTRDLSNLPTGSPPDTRINKAKIHAKKHSAKFSFKAIGKASGFQCALIKAKKGKKISKPSKLKFSSCHSPKRYKFLKPGHYTFEVRALNSAGVDPTPAKKSFSI